MEKKEDLQILSKRIIRYSFILPFLAIFLPLVLEFDSFHTKINIISALIAFVACLFWARYIGRGMIPVLLTLVISIFVRAGAVIAILFTDWEHSAKTVAVLFLIGYHFLETGVVAAGSWRILLAPPSVKES